VFVFLHLLDQLQVPKVEQETTSLVLEKHYQLFCIGVGDIKILRA
jgi:hypothetical protein